MKKIIIFLFFTTLCLTGFSQIDNVHTQIVKVKVDGEDVPNNECLTILDNKIRIEYCLTFETCNEEELEDLVLDFSSFSGSNVTPISQTSFVATNAPEHEHNHDCHHGCYWNICGIFEVDLDFNNNCPSSNDEFLLDINLLVVGSPNWYDRLINDCIADQHDFYKASTDDVGFILLDFSLMICCPSATEARQKRISSVTENEINIFPNPCSNNLIIDNINDFSNIRIINNQGIIISEHVISDKTSNTLDVSNLLKGYYFVSLQRKNQPKSIYKKIYVLN